MEMATEIRSLNQLTAHVGSEERLLMIDNNGSVIVQDGERRRDFVRNNNCRTVYLSKIQGVLGHVDLGWILGDRTNEKRILGGIFGHRYKFNEEWSRMELERLASVSWYKYGLENMRRNQGKK